MSLAAARSLRSNSGVHKGPGCKLEGIIPEGARDSWSNVHTEQAARNVKTLTDKRRRELPDSIGNLSITRTFTARTTERL